MIRIILRLLAGFCLPSGKHLGIITYYQTKVKTFSGYLAQLLRYTALPNARRTRVLLCSIKAASLAMRAKLLAKNK